MGRPGLPPKDTPIHLGLGSCWMPKGKSSFLFPLMQRHPWGLVVLGPHGRIECPPHTMGQGLGSY